MKQRFRGPFSALVLAVAVLATAACQSPGPGNGPATVAPAAAQQDDVRIGRRLHPKTVLAFGGEIRNPKVRAYVDKVGQNLIRTSGIQGVRYTFTVVNSDIVNAFSLPGGYIYITRALVQLADTEAQLASILAHEIGHVAARHAVQRYNRETVVSVATGAGIPVIGSVLSRVVRASTGADVWLRQYSREQEFESDKLAVRYLAQANYDVGGLADFLAKLRAQSRLQARLAGRADNGDQYNALATHPRTADRVRVAMAAANSRPKGSERRHDGRNALLAAIDGMNVDGDAKNGFIKRSLFIHPGLRIRFNAPAGFRLVNLPRRVVAVGPSGTLMQVDGVRVEPDLPVGDYLRRVWGQRAELLRIQTLKLNGLPAATAVVAGTLKGREVILRLLVIKYEPGRFYRYIFLSPAPLAARFDPIYQRAALTFRKLSPAETAQAQPLRLRVVTVRRGDTVASLARRMAYDRYRIDRFVVLNGLRRGQALRPGRKVKIVTD